MKIKEFDFELPDELIARYPVNPRDSSRLLRLEQGKITEHKFNEITDYFNPGDVLVFNDSRVIKGYLLAEINRKKVSFNLIDFNPEDTQNITILGKPKKLFQQGVEVKVSEDFRFNVKCLNEDGTIKVSHAETASELMKKLDKYGSMPLPPYILKKRGISESDEHDYQTVYAKNSGSVAAPTAGLHFTEELLKKIRDKGVEIAYITLHVGAGTFLPVKTESIDNHKMHSEIVSVSRETCEAINKAKISGGKVISVGTTSLRTLESLADDRGFLMPWAGSTDIFIKPGYKFKVVDKLITNFHLPKSTLLILISAFLGSTNIKNLYEYAVSNKFRFFSYGDACLLEKV